MKRDSESPNAIDSTSSEYSASNKFTILKNLTVLCFGFPLMFCAYKALANLQSTMNREQGVGVISQSVIYACFIISSLLLPKMFIRRIGCKRTLVLCILAYSPYIAVNAYSRFETILPTSIVLGLAAGPLWSAQSVYLTEIGRQYSTLTHEDNSVIISRFFGLFSTAYGTTDVWGNLVSYYVLSPADSTSNYSNRSVPSCGIDFCFSSGESNHNLDPPTDTKRYILISVYLLISLLSALLIALFLDNNLTEKTRLERAYVVDDDDTVLSLVGATVRTLCKFDLLLLVPITIFSGAERAFFTGEFTMGYIGCAWGIYHVGFVCICYGVINAISSFASGYMLQFFPRAALIAVGCLATLSCCAGLVLWRPWAEESYIFFILASLWGFIDAVFHTQLRALYGTLFKGDEEGAFSNFLLWESVGNVIIFSSSKYSCMKLKISMIVLILGAGMIGYFSLEIRNRKKRLSLTQ